MQKNSIVETRRNYENNTFTVIFDSADYRLEAMDPQKQYPEGTIFINDCDVLRYALVPTDAA